MRLETALGPIDIEVDLGRAPRMGGNFLRYLDRGYYDGASFVRVENHAEDFTGRPIEVPMIQAIIPPDRIPFAPVLFERTQATGLRHVDGTVSAIRISRELVSHRFLICIGDQPDLDLGGRRIPDGQGYGAFGRVVAGMEVVRRIHGSPSRDNAFTPPIPILRARRL